MSSEEQIEFLENSFQKKLELAKKKGADYAGEDVLSNLKIVSKVVELIGIDCTKPEGYAMQMVITKIVRIWNLKNKGVTPQNESLDDSYNDVSVYIDLARMSELEVEKLKVVPKLFEKNG